MKDRVWLMNIKCELNNFDVLDVWAGLCRSTDGQLSLSRFGLLLKLEDNEN